MYLWKLQIYDPCGLCFRKYLFAVLTPISNYSHMVWWKSILITFRSVGHYAYCYIVRIRNN